MQLAALILAAVVMPYLWGCAAYWFINRVWPDRKVTPPEPADPTPAPTDFQI